MKKLAYMLSLMLLTLPVVSYAQTTSGTPDANYSIYKNKLKKSEDNLTNEKKTVSAKYWLSRADLMMDIFELHREFLAQGTLAVHVKLVYGEPLETKQWQDDEGAQFEEYKYDKVVVVMKNGGVDSFEEISPLYDKPLDAAYEALGKAEELDTESKNAKIIKELYVTLKSQFERYAIELFFKDDYKGSFDNFAAIYSVNQSPLMEGAVDTMMLYYTGMAASRADLTDESIKYYELAKDNGCPEPDLYVFLKQKYFEIGDTAKGISVLEEGFTKDPDNQSVLIELINYYLNNDRGEEALEYLTIAQEDDPTNLSFIFAEATLHDKMGETEKALETYQRCIAIDPAYFNAYYNIGVMYFNKAVEMYKEADEIGTPKEYGDAIDAADKVLVEALPFMEKAHELDPTELSTLETLKTLYYRMEMTDKYDEVSAQIEALGGSTAAEGEPTETMEENR